MGGESSSSSSSLRWSPVEDETDLFRSQGAKLFLIDGEESVLLQMGDFALFLVKHARSPLAAVVAMVNDVQWPVGKDSPVIRVGDRSFTYALPGLMYGLVLAEHTDAADVQKLEVLLREYATFEVHSDVTTAAIRSSGLEGGRHEETEERKAAEYWTRVAEEVESKSTRMARQLQSRWWAGTSNTILRGRQMAELSLQRGGKQAVHEEAGSKRGAGGVSPRMMKRIQQARRLSAIAKLFSKTLVKGAINAVSHVEGAGVASVDAVAKVVEAVETAGKSVETERYGDDTARQAAEEGRRGWTLNKLGLSLLYRATAASTAMHSGGGSGCSSSSSSGSGGLRHLSSSSSTSSKVYAHGMPPLIAPPSPPRPLPVPPPFATSVMPPPRAVFTPPRPPPPPFNPSRSAHEKPSKP